MKSMLQLNKVITAFLFFFFIYSFSCSEHVHEFTGGPEIIQITDGDISSEHLTLKDIDEKPADTFKIGKGKKILWLLVSNKTVTKITNIYKKPKSDNVFSLGPESVGGSPNWRGTINRDAGGKTEDYSIAWTDTAGNSHTYDPKIQVY